MSVTAVHLLYKHTLEPVVRLEENVKLLLPGDAEVYGRVTFSEPVQPKIIGLGPIAAASSLQPLVAGSTKKLAELELGEYEFGQWRLLVMEDYLLEVKQPASMGRFLTKSGPSYLNKFTITMPQLAEIFTYRDYVPTVVPYNYHFKEIDNARVLAVGIRYIIEPLTSKPSEYTVIPVSGKPITTGG